ncbi:MAG: ComEC/Rec2 family competence protein [Elusimicrobiales bacterium]|nr:ComEC/Rec2 family competence protein [Elusimicrobiales bacterium]
MLFSYYRRPLFLLLLLYAGGILLFRDFFIKPPEALPFALPRSGVLIEGRVAEYPAAAPGGARFALETSRVYGRPLRTGLMVYARSPAAASYGDRVSFLADLDAPPGASVPGSLDWAEYLLDRGVVAQARARELEISAPANAFIRLARRFRYSAMSAFEAGLPPEAASVLGGVVLGEKKSVPPGLKTAFQDSGAMHLLVASGSNVGFVVAVVYFLCARLGLKKKRSGLAALALAGFYVTAAGMDTPLVRAYIMFSAGLCAWVLRREAGAFHALTAACLLILALWPRYIFDAGFLMSALAAYGLIVGMALWGRYAKKGGLAGYAAGLFLMSFFAQLCLYPLLAVYFHKISLISLVSNMVLVPASGLAMGLGFLLALLSGAGAVFTGLAYVTGHFMEAFIGAVRFFAGLPFSSVSVAEPSSWFVAGFFVLALALLHAPLLGFSSRRLYLVSAFGLLLISAGPLMKVSAAGPVKCRAVLFGDSNTSSALIRVPSGLFLVNPGVNGKKLADSVFTEGSRTLEGIILTSLEEKNFSGLGDLSGSVAIKKVFLPYGPREGGLKKILAGLEKSGARIYRVWPGEVPGPELKVAAGWGGRGAGYSGRGDVLDWEVETVTIRKEGGHAERACSCTECPAPVSVQKGKTVALEFGLPAASCVKPENKDSI